MLTKSIGLLVCLQDTFEKEAMLEHLIQKVESSIWDANSDSARAVAQARNIPESAVATYMRDLHKLTLPVDTQAASFTDKMTRLIKQVHHEGRSFCVATCCEWMTVVVLSLVHDQPSAHLNKDSRHLSQCPCSLRLCQSRSSMHVQHTLLSIFGGRRGVTCQRPRSFGRMCDTCWGCAYLYCCSWVARALLVPLSLDLCYSGASRCRPTVSLALNGFCLLDSPPCTAICGSIACRSLHDAKPDALAIERKSCSRSASVEWLAVQDDQAGDFAFSLFDLDGDGYIVEQEVHERFARIYWCAPQFGSCCE